LNRLLLLEDDPSLSKSLMKYLRQNGYSVDWAKNGKEALSLSYENEYMLYLLDINVPLLNGIDLLSALREAEDKTPAIIISAQIDVHSVTQGFIAGADDYVKKPFDPEELLIRVQAKTSQFVKYLSFGKYKIDLKTKQIYEGELPLYFGRVQQNLFISLVQNYPNPVTKEELMLLLDKPSDLALRVNITTLRNTLDVEIKSVRGVGYQII